MGDTSGLLNQLREADRRRYLSVLFAPDDRRAARIAVEDEHAKQRVGAVASSTVFRRRRVRR